MSEPRPLAATTVFAAATEFLEAGGYHRVKGSLADYPETSARIFEDAYSIVAVVTYETWPDLHSGWHEAQAALVELMSKHISTGEPKAWEGYLVLLTPGTPDSVGRVEQTRIRYDTLRVRKLLATGSDLKQLSDVERVLLPLLPLVEVGTFAQPLSVLEALPGLLARQGVEEEVARVAIRAYLDQQPALERLYEHLGRT